MEPIFVTKPSLPPLDDFGDSLKEIWHSSYITNDGKFHKKLEAALAEYLGVKHISVFSNGTIALVTALQALGIEGEVITTPYSFVATANALIWNRVTPVFADINPFDCNLNVDAIENAITEKTTAIMPVHVYGTCCDVERIEALAKKYNLKVIYDAAHAFGVKMGDQSVLNYGDLSVLSFHATKVFNTIEGGAIVSHSKEMKTKIDNLKNFGIIDEVTVVDAGINGKMNELQAAYGLLNLEYIDEKIEARKKVSDYYSSQLQSVEGINLLDIMGASRHNYSYFPIFIQDDCHFTRDQLYQALRKENIFSRRYFYPLISEFPMYQSLPSADRNNLPNSWQRANSVLCLPMFPDLKMSEIDRIVNIIKRMS